MSFLSGRNGTGKRLSLQADTELFGVDRYQPTSTPPEVLTVARRPDLQRIVPTRQREQTGWTEDCLRQSGLLGCVGKALEKPSSADLRGPMRAAGRDACRR